MNDTTVRFEDEEVKDGSEPEVEAMADDDAEDEEGEKEEKEEKEEKDDDEEKEESE